MMKASAASPQTYARTGGVLYLIFGMQLAGVRYLVNSFALLLFPDLSSVLFPAILLPAFVAELSTALWLTFKGVNLPKWREHQAATAGV